MPSATKRIRIDFGINESPESLEALLQRLFGPHGLAGREPAVLDLADCGYLGPLGASVIAGLKYQRAEPNALMLEPPANKRTEAYCRYSGLLELFGVGPPPDAHPENVTTPVRQFVKRPQTPMDEVANLVRRLMRFSDQEETKLRTCLAELADNVIYHARSSVGGMISARAFKNEKEVRFVVADFGVGFRKSLSKNILSKNRVPTKDDLDAIQKAIKSGISGRSTPRNLGEGLPLLADIVTRSGGRLVLASQQGMLSLGPGYSRAKLLSHPYPGSIAIVRLKISDSAHEGKIVDVWA